jgi:hypothetical protein
MSTYRVLGLLIGYLLLFALWWNARAALRFLPFESARQFARYGAMVVLTLALLAMYLTASAAELPKGLNTAPCPVTIPGVCQMPCDVNGNGVLDPNDLALLESQIGNPFAPPGDPADANFDGAVTPDDLAICRARMAPVQQVQIPTMSVTVLLLTGTILAVLGTFGSIRRRPS